MDSHALWRQMQAEARAFSSAEPALASFYHASVLAHRELAGALSYTLAEKLHSADLPSLLLRQLFLEAYRDSPALVDACVRDLLACVERDPACDHYAMPLLFFKGFQALQCYRAAHWLWQRGRRSMALYFQNQIAQTFDVDIHPAATLGAGILMDHATGIVIGQTAVVGDDVSMLHGVTLGGSGYSKGDRHPKIGNGVLISAQAKLLGNIRIGDGAKIAGGSLVLDSVPAHTTVAGVPAKPVGRPASLAPAHEMNHHTGDESD